MILPKAYVVALVYGHSDPAQAGFVVDEEGMPIGFQPHFETRTVLSSVIETSLGNAIAAARASVSGRDELEGFDEIHSVAQQVQLTMGWWAYTWAFKDYWWRVLRRRFRMWVGL